MTESRRTYQNASLKYGGNTVFYLPFDSVDGVNQNNWRATSTISKDRSYDVSRAYVDVGTRGNSQYNSSDYTVSQTTSIGFFELGNSSYNPGLSENPQEGYLTYLFFNTDYDSLPNLELGQPMDDTQSHLFLAQFIKDSSTTSRFWRQDYRTIFGPGAYVEYTDVTGYHPTFRFDQGSEVTFPAVPATVSVGDVILAALYYDNSSNKVYAIAMDDSNGDLSDWDTGLAVPQATPIATMVGYGLDVGPTLGVLWQTFETPVPIDDVKRSVEWYFKNWRLNKKEIAPDLINKIGNTKMAQSKTTIGTLNDASLYSSTDTFWNVLAITNLIGNKVGYDPVFGTDRHYSLRFPNTAMPADSSKIESATLSLKFEAKVNNPDLTVSIHSIADAPVADLTNGPTTWASTISVGTFSNIPLAPNLTDATYNIDVTSQIKQLVTNNAWVSGNAVQFLLTASNPTTDSLNFTAGPFCTSAPTQDPNAYFLTVNFLDESTKETINSLSSGNSF